MSTTDSEGPAWNKFWLSLDNETESVMSGEGGSRVPQTPDQRSLTSHDIGRPAMPDRGDSVMPNESASHHGESPSQSAIAASAAMPIEEIPFAFKFKAPSGRVHRLQIAASSGIENLFQKVAGKLGSEVDAIGGIPVFEGNSITKPGFAMSYLDNEGDTISITTDQDLIEAISISRMANRDKVDLFVHDPEKPAIHATLEPRPSLPKPLTPPDSILKERRRQLVDDEDEEAESTMSRTNNSRQGASPAKQEEQFVAGVPNELLLPGAIVTLAVVIVGVFALSRTSSR